MTAGPATTNTFSSAAIELGARRPIRNARLLRIASRIQHSDLELAENALRAYLLKDPQNADALRLMSQIAVGRGHRAAALSILERCLELAPDFDLARFNYADLLFKSKHFQRALNEISQLLVNNDHNPLFRQLQANILETVGETESAITIFEQLAAENPGRAESWISFGHALRGLGRQADSVAAYRKALECRPSYGLAYWSLANLKTTRFSDEDIKAIQDQLKTATLVGDDRIYMNFALGKALEDRNLYERSFEQYSKANAAARLRIKYNPEILTKLVADSKALFTGEFFANRSEAGCTAPDPIFVLSLPRSGSTLVEQILSTHSTIEGAGELPNIPGLARRLNEVEGAAQGTSYPKILGKLGSQAFTALGEEYLEGTRVYRKLGRMFFIDKKPANLHHVGLIHLILPKAKIIDVRRHPAACCLSAFKHHFTTARPNLSEFGRFYRDYVELMAHFDSVLPGKIHRVIYEDMVSNPEAEVRRLLDYLGLPFEEGCLRFYETKRTVLTPSAEQVRKPISGEAVDHWRHYEPWLGTLIRSLGSALTAYPSVPEELR